MDETPEAPETDPWHARIRSAPTPTVLYHATTPRKLARYRATGTILPPVRGFDTVEACQRFMRRTGRTLMLRVTPTMGPWPLPDHHHASGLAWWTTDIAEDWGVVEPGAVAAEGDTGSVWLGLRRGRERADFRQEVNADWPHAQPLDAPRGWHLHIDTAVHPSALAELRRLAAAPESFRPVIRPVDDSRKFLLGLVDAARQGDAA